jgi:branched-chain amino acid transport system substrate-binding protein
MSYYAKNTFLHSLSKVVSKVAFFAILGIGFSFSVANAKTVKIGLLSGVSGPIASMAPAIVSGSRLAIRQVNQQGGLFKNGSTLLAVFGDSGCNPQNAIDAATKVVNLNNISAMVGPNCSGATIAAAEAVNIPAGVPLISPSATAPTVSALNDNDLVFRTVPSDAYQGQALARTLISKGMKSVAVAYVNNDYGKGIADSFKAEFEKQGGTIKGYEGHEGAKASYRSQLASLAGKGASTLVIFDYASDSGMTILRQSLENGFFENFVGADGMKSDLLVKELGEENLGTLFVSSPIGKQGEALARFNKAFTDYGQDKDAVFANTSYDAAFILALAIEKAGSGDRAAVAKNIRSVSSAPGLVILPGEWAKAKKAISKGQDINYEGATGSHEFDKNGDVPGTYALFKVSGGNLVVDVNMK